MSAYKQSTPTSNICKKPSDGSYTSKTSAEVRVLTFCSGDCENAIGFEDLCAACIYEWCEYEKEKL